MPVCYRCLDHGRIWTSPTEWERCPVCDGNVWTVDRCPGRLVERSMLPLVASASTVIAGHGWPVEGGRLDQTPAFLEALELCALVHGKFLPKWDAPETDGQRAP